jgi:hypothetical protein
MHKHHKISEQLSLSQFIDMMEDSLIISVESRDYRSGVSPTHARKASSTEAADGHEDTPRENSFNAEFGINTSKNRKKSVVVVGGGSFVTKLTKRHARIAFSQSQVRRYELKEHSASLCLTL